MKVFHKKDKLDKERHANWMPNKEKVKEIKESMGQKFYVLENFRRPNPLPRRDVLKVDLQKLYKELKRMKKHMEEGL